MTRNGKQSRRETLARRVRTTHTWQYAPRYAQDAIESFIKKLASADGISVTDAPLPVEMRRAHEVHQTIYDKSLAYYFKGEHKQSDFVSPVYERDNCTGECSPAEASLRRLPRKNELIREHG